MVFAIMALLFLLGMTLKKSKCIYFLEFIFMWVILSFCENTKRFDYENYTLAFKRFGIQAASVSNSEIGYQWLNRLFYGWGFGFEQLNMLLVFVSLLLVAATIPKYTKNISIVSSLYMIYPLFLNGIQIRNMIVASVILWGIQYLLLEEKRSVPKYILCVAVAVTFHSAAIIYLGLIAVVYCSERQIGTISMLGLFVITSVFQFIYPFLQILFGQERLASKITDMNTYFQVLLAVLWQASICIIVFFLSRHQKNHVAGLIHKVNLFMLIILPLYYIDFSMERLQRNILLLSFLVFANSFTDSGDARRVEIRIWQLGFLGWFFASAIVFEGWYSDHWEKTVLPYLQQNTVFCHFGDYIVVAMLLLLFAVLLFVMDSKRVVIRLPAMKKIICRKGG